MGSSSQSSGVVLIVLTAALAGCGDDGQGAGTTGGSGLAVGASGGNGGQGSGAGGQGAIGNAGGDGGSGNGGEGGGGPTSLDDLLERLRQDRDGTLLDESQGHGWPVLTDQGYVVVDADPALPSVAGDFDGWIGTPLTPDQGFSYAVVPLAPGDGYKLTDGVAYESDPWARAYNYDQFGELSLFQPASAHLERHVVTGHPTLDDRTVRVWVPASAPTHLLYVHDGQNLFDPNAFFGGWKLQESVPPAMMLVGIDNTAARMDEYTHVTDLVGGSPIGGDGDTYADYVQSVIRSLVADHYGEPVKVGVMGSSLGGLISLHIAQRHPGEYDFAASLSGTLGWGSIGLENETMIERYEIAGNQGTAIYIDSGGGGTCIDSDADGIEDDGTGSDNYCETLQLLDVAQAVGFTLDVDLWHWWEPGAAHDEAAWASRVWRPLEAFAAL